MAEGSRRDRGGVERGWGELLLVLGLIGIAALAGPTLARGSELPAYLADRGTGLPTSLFGTYVRRGELLVYPFYEYTYDSNEEYKPSDLGYTGDDEHKGTSIEHEVLLFLSYGLTDWLMVEVEGAVWTKKVLFKDEDDDSNTPGRVEESGLGDVESQVRWRWFRETEGRPELFSFFETVFPLQRSKKLIGTQDWEFSLGLGAIKGFGWGTLTARAALTYEKEEDELKLGEYALEYLKRLSPSWRVVATVEGEEDEVSLIGEAQWFLSENIFLKLNSGFGITEKAPDWAPEVGVMFAF